ncbi:MAG: hypothetical protein QG599_1962 [Pseudomonadota bacterium]|nr:hypothetical protein [Pseudomonadota bacterium]
MTTAIDLEHRESAHNRLRFYRITVTRALFNDWTVIRESSRIGYPGMVHRRRFQNLRPKGNNAGATCSDVILVLSQ